MLERPQRVRAETAQGSLSYRPDIDGMRAVAILLVVAYHAFPEKFPGGFIGVDVFFVISGYLITGLITREMADGAFSFIGFYRRRIRRLFPALALVLAVCMTFGAFVLFPLEYRGLGKHVTAASVYLLNFVLMNEVGYFDEANVRKPLMHLWSLSVEEQFYFVWPACLVLLVRAGLTERARKILGVVACLGILSFALHVLAFKQNGAAVHYSPFVRFWQLLLGAYLAMTTPPPRWQKSGLISLPGRQYWHHAASGAGVFAIVLSGFLIYVESAMTALVPALGAALVIAAGSDSFLNKAILSQRSVVGLGLISYALYLWHWPILSFRGSSRKRSWPRRLQ
jgi:peptidoglycan/LPS O-acetylase OafA/YrhL